MFMSENAVKQMPIYIYMYLFNEIISKVNLNEVNA